jgi:hypothetical protein
MDPTVPHSHGYYYALSSGQFNLYGEGPVDDLGAQYFYAKFTANMDALQFPTPGDPPTTGGYARITGPDFDGAANLPSMSDGRCSMAGTWDIPGYDMSPVEPPATITFDAQGNFVGYAQTDPPCSQSAMYGTYRLTPGMFQLTSNVGMGTCQWMQIAGYPAAFDASCDQLTLTRMYDNCTGGRGYFNGPTTVLRRE